MTVTPHEDTRPAESDAGTYDVVIRRGGTLFAGTKAAVRPDAVTSLAIYPEPAP